MYQLPTDIIRLIYEFDGTYREKYNDVMNELINTMDKKRYGSYEPPTFECLDYCCMGFNNVFMGILLICVSPFFIIISPCLIYDEIKNRN